MVRVENLDSVVAGTPKAKRGEWAKHPDVPDLIKGLLKQDISLDKLAARVSDRAGQRVTKPMIVHWCGRNGLSMAGRRHGKPVAAIPSWYKDPEIINEIYELYLMGQSYPQVLEWLYFQWEIETTAATLSKHMRKYGMRWAERNENAYWGRDPKKIAAVTKFVHVGASKPRICLMLKRVWGVEISPTGLRNMLERQLGLKAKKVDMSIWSIHPEVQDLVRDLAFKKMSSKIIAQLINEEIPGWNVTRNMVAGWCARNNVRLQGTNVKNSNGSESQTVTKRIIKAKPAEKPPQRPKSTIVHKSPITDKKPLDQHILHRAQPSVAATTEGVSLLDRGDNQCPWIIEGVQQAMCCGQPKGKRALWCDEHRALARQ